MSVVNLVGSSQINTNEITVGWVDGGTVEGKFTQGLLEVLMTCPLPLQHYLRIQGCVIAANRGHLLSIWYNQSYTDWLLWVDSDIVLNSEAILKLRESIDPVNKPIITGTYFLPSFGDKLRPIVIPALFTESSDGKHELYPLKDLPEDTLIEVDSAGFGFVLMHRSAITKMIEHHGDINFFAPKAGIVNPNAEDFCFFENAKEAGIPLYAHTGAIVDHIKKVPIDLAYYQLHKE